MQSHQAVTTAAAAAPASSSSFSLAVASSSSSSSPKHKQVHHRTNKHFKIDADPSISTDDIDRILNPSEDSSCLPSSSRSRGGGGGNGGSFGGIGGSGDGSGSGLGLTKDDSNFSEDDLMACSSADSIIRRVEEEIANAKKASLLAKSRMDSNLDINNNSNYYSKQEGAGDGLGLEGEFYGRSSDDLIDENASDSEPSVDMLDILDINESEDDENRHQQYHQQYHPTFKSNAGNTAAMMMMTTRRRPPSPPEDDYFQGAMDMIGEEFDTPSPSSPPRHFTVHDVRASNSSSSAMADEKKVDEEQQEEQHEKYTTASMEFTANSVSKSFETAPSHDEDGGASILPADTSLSKVSSSPAHQNRPPPPTDDLNNNDNLISNNSLTIDGPSSPSLQLLPPPPEPAAVSSLLEEENDVVESLTSSSRKQPPPPVVEDSSSYLNIEANDSFVSAADFDDVHDSNQNDTDYSALNLKLIPSHGSNFSRTSSSSHQNEQTRAGETGDAGRRARAILDTLKSRREHFSSTFRTSKSISSPKSSSGEDGNGGLGFLDDNINSSRSGSGSPPTVSAPPAMLMIGADGGEVVVDSEENPTATRLIDIDSALKTKDVVSTDSTLNANDAVPNDSWISSSSPSLPTTTTTPTIIENELAVPSEPTISTASMPLRRGEASSTVADEKKDDDSSKATSVASAAISPSILVNTSADPLINKRGASLPSPDKKKFKNRPPNFSSSFSTTVSGEDRKKSQVEEAFCRKSRRIRFRDPFPVLKPASRPRDAKEIIASNAVGAPEPLIRWLRPKNDLRQLIVAVMGASLQRRSNACGALKVLTQNKKNQMMLMRTDSFLESLVFAASQDIHPIKDRELAVDARTRAVSCLRNVCEPKDNRGFVIMHPGFKEALSKVIREDRMEARVIACGAFALLARTPECREPMVQAEGMVDLLAEVVSGALDKNQMGSSSSVHAEETAINATVSEDSHTGTAGLSNENNSIRSKQSSVSGLDGDDNEDEDDEDENSDGSDDNSSRSSDYSSSESEEEEDSDHHPPVLVRSRSPRSQLPPRSARSPTAERKTEIEGRSASRAGPARFGPPLSLPSHADDLVQLNSIRQINQEMQSEFQQRARSNACAALLHLSKHCAISHRLCSNACLLENLLAVAREEDNTIHTKCLEILCNLSRFPANTGFMTRFPSVVETLVAAADSNVPEDRTSALRALQNMSADSSSKTLLASETVLSAMSAAALRRAPDEKEAAVAFLYNVSTEPGAVVSITNTKNVVATLVHLAHHPESASNIRLMACDALATISLWLQTLAGTGKVPADVVNVPLPSQKTTGWDRWE